MDTSVKESVDKLRTKIQKEDKKVLSVSDPYTMMTISKDKKIGYADIMYKENADNVSEESKNKVLQSINITRNACIETELGGDVSFSKLEVATTLEREAGRKGLAAKVMLGKVSSLSEITGDVKIYEEYTY